MGTPTYVGVNNAAGQNAGTTTTAGTASITPTLPGSTAVGDRVFVIQCASNTSGTTPTNWTVLGTKDATVGSGTVAAGSGARRITVYYRDYDGVWTMPAFTLTSATNNSHWIGAVSIRKTSSSYMWNTPSIAPPTGAFNTSTTAYSDQIPSFTTIAGAFAIVATCLNDNVTATGGTLAQTGATFASVTERADGGTATGNDVSGKVHTGTVTTGATATMTFSLTLSAASQGETVVIQQTESLPPAGAAISTLTDEFASINTAVWDSFGTGGSFSASGGAAVYSTGSIFTNGGLQADAVYDLTNGQLVFKVPTMTLPGSSDNAQFGLMQEDGTTFWGFRYTLSGGIIYAQAVINGTASGTLLTVNGPFWFRIRHSSSGTPTIYYEYTTDGGATWSVLNSTTTMPTRVDRLRPYFFVNSPSGSSVTAQFTSVNLPPGPPISTLTQDFNTDATGFSGSWSRTSNTFQGTATHFGFPVTVDGTTTNTYSIRSSGMVWQQTLVSQTGGAANSVQGGFLAVEGFWGIRINPLTNTAQAVVDDALVGSTRTHTNNDWYRIREDAGTLYFDYFSGTVWATLHSTTTLPARPDRVQGLFRASVVDAAQSVTGGIDNFGLPPTIGPIALFQDDFESVTNSSPPDPTKWEIYTSPGGTAMVVDKNTLGIGDASEQALLVEVNTEPTVSLAQAASNLLNAAPYSINGSSFTVEVPVAQVTGVDYEPIGGAGATCSIALSNYNQVGQDGGFGIYLSGGVLTLADSSLTTTAAYSATNHRFLRFRESGGTLYWETSPDGSSWSTFSSAPTADYFPDNKVYPNLIAFSFDASLADAAFIVDNINLAPTATTPTNLFFPFFG